MIENRPWCTCLWKIGTGCYINNSPTIEQCKYTKVYNQFQSIGACPRFKWRSSYKLQHISSNSSKHWGSLNRIGGKSTWNCSNFGPNNFASILDFMVINLLFYLKEFFWKGKYSSPFQYLSLFRLNGRECLGFWSGAEGGWRPFCQTFIVASIKMEALP